MHSSSQASFLPFLPALQQMAEDYLGLSPRVVGATLDLRIAVLYDNAKEAPIGWRIQFRLSTNLPGH